MKQNQVQLIGNVGNDVKVDNEKVVRFSIAVNENIPKTRDANGNVTEWENKPNWFNIVVFNPKKEWYEKLKKGTRVLVTGKLRPDEKESKKAPGFKYIVYEIAAETTLIIETERKDGVQTTTIQQQSKTETNSTQTPEKTETNKNEATPSSLDENLRKWPNQTEQNSQQPTQQTEEKPSTMPGQMPPINEMDVIEDLPF